MHRASPLDLGRHELLRPAVRADRLGRVVERVAVATAADQELPVEPATEMVLRIMGDLHPWKLLDQLGIEFGIGKGIAHGSSVLAGIWRRFGSNEVWERVQYQLRWRMGCEKAVPSSAHVEGACPQVSPLARIA